MKPLTIVDIARMANVSQRTVSGIMNNNIQVTEQTKQRVLDIIQKTKYSPNVSARMLGRSRSKETARTDAIGVIFSQAIGGNTGIKGNVFSAIVNSAIMEAKNSKLKSFVDIIPRDYNETTDIPAIIADSLVDGLVIVGWVGLKFISQVLSMTIPAVCVHGHGAGAGIHEVMIDEFRGAYDLVAYLINAGHERIGMLDMNNSWGYKTNKLDGYKKALADRGLRFDENLVQVGTYADYGYKPDMEGLEERVVKLIKNNPAPTAIFGADDEVAFKISSILELNGLKVPGDISLVGFDNARISSEMKPPLTTVDIFSEEVGKIAVKRLNELICGESSIPAKTLIEPKLIERESVRKISR